MDILKSLVQIMDQLFKTLGPYGDGIRFALACVFIGLFSAKMVFTKTSWYKRGPIGVWFFWWGYKTLAWHPFMAGLFYGALMPRSGAYNIPDCVNSALYFAVWGAGTVWLYEATKGLLKKKTGVDFERIMEGS